jgi:phage/plasmid-like protein (TIGR03299 family)
MRKSVLDSFKTNGGGTFKEKLESYDLAFSVSSRPVYFPRNESLTFEGENMCQAPDKKAIYREDRERYLATVGDSYTIVQFYEALGFIETLLEGNELEVISGFSADGGARCYLRCALPDVIRLVGDDEITNEITVSTSHDGTSRVKVISTPVRKKAGTVMIHNKDAVVSFKHCTRVSENWENFSVNTQRLLRVQVNDVEARAFIHNLIDSENKKSSQAESTEAHIYSIWKNVGVGRLAAGANETLFGLYQAVTEYADFYKLIKKPRRHGRDMQTAQVVGKLEDGSARLKFQAWAMSLNLMRQKVDL